MKECLNFGVCAAHMREGLIEIRTGGASDDDKDLLWAEVWHQGEIVHRSVNVKAKKPLFALFGIGQIS